MTTSNKPASDTHRKKPTLIIAVVVGVLLLGFTTFNIYGQLNQPSLGPQLEYIGQRKFGCLLVILCESSSPYSDYYFATDMTEDQLKVYFKGAHLKTLLPGGEWTSDVLGFQTDNNQYFDIYYYSNIRQNQTYPFKNTNKFNGISIKDSGYKIAKEAL